MKRIVAPEAPAAVGPYSHAVVHQNIAYISGQLGIDPGTNMLESTLESQTHRAMKNLIHVLETCGGTVHDLIKCTIYLSDMDAFKVVNAIYESYLEGSFPARVALAVKTLPLNGLVEIDAIAAVK